MTKDERLIHLHDGDEIVLTEPFEAGSEEDERAFRRRLQERTIGRDAEMDTPFGRKRIAYFDYVASGRLFADIEDELNEKALPFMANTHTEATYTGKRMTRLCKQAARRIASYTGAGEDDAVIFTEYGCTGAVNKMIRVLGLRLPDQLEETFALSSHVPDEARPVVFTSLMEHHSNDLAWRETIGDTVYVGFDADGRISLEDLETKLRDHAGRPFKIGSFSAGSNITGITSDTYEIAKILHRHGALAFFDYAAAGPYVDIDMNPQRPGDPEAHLASKDGVFLSPHKFPGGPRTPGILVAKKALFTNKVPTVPGGGTVLYTTPWSHHYLPDIEARESGGTPPILQIIQAGLVFDLKARIGVPRIREIERGYMERALARWRDDPALTILGRRDLEGLGILSVVFRDAHYNLITSILNDRFGVQARAGCMCAGPYGHELLGIDRLVSDQIREQLRCGHIGAKPGWVRFSFSAVTAEEDFRVLLEAVDFVSKKWRDLAPRYRQVPETGEFVHAGG